MNEKLEVKTLNNQKIVAIAYEDGDYPAIDLYIDNGEDLLLVGRVEDSNDKGLRIFTYSDLSSDDYVSVEEIK